MKAFGLEGIVWRGRGFTGIFEEVAMYEDVKGKKLLVLGAYASETDIVNAARKMGVYTITTDNHTNWDDAPAKKVSDEAWNISYMDIDALAEKCRESHVDGVMAGVGGLRVRSALALSEKLDTPFYARGGG